MKCNKILYFLKRNYTRIILKIKNKGKKSIICSSYIDVNTSFGKYNYIGKKVWIGKDVSIGDYTYINSDYNWTTIDSNISIGKFCSIGPCVTIGIGNHNYNYVSTHPFLYDDKYKIISNAYKLKYDENIKTTIENDVWIGANSNIKRGVIIGNGAVIGMNAVVTKNVPPYAIVAGIPAKIIGYRFKKDEIEFLEKSKWWDFSKNKLIKMSKNMYSIDEFILNYKDM